MTLNPVETLFTAIVPITSSASTPGTYHTVFNIFSFISKDKNVFFLSFFFVIIYISLPQLL